jgi:hypothetical protein
MEVLRSVCLGLALAAACGFRVFVPLLVVSAAARAEWLPLAQPFAWIGTTPALIAFAVATGLEIAAYYVPWLDHLLDTLAWPFAVAAGILLSAAVLTDVDPLLRWTLAIVAGGGAAGTVHAITTGARAVSGATTLGLANPLVATAELAGSLLLSIVSIVLPVLAVLLAGALGLGLLSVTLLFRSRRPG